MAKSKHGLYAPKGCFIDDASSPNTILRVSMVETYSATLTVSGGEIETSISTQVYVGDATGREFDFAPSSRVSVDFAYSSYSDVDELLADLEQARIDVEIEELIDDINAQYREWVSDNS